MLCRLHSFSWLSLSVLFVDRGKVVCYHSYKGNIFGTQPTVLPLHDVGASSAIGMLLFNQA